MTTSTERPVCSLCWMQDHEACERNGHRCGRPHPDEPWTQLRDDVKAGDSLTAPVVGAGWCAMAGEDMTEGTIIVQDANGIARTWPLGDAAQTELDEQHNPHLVRLRPTRLYRCTNQSCVRYGSQLRVSAGENGPFWEWPLLRCRCGTEPTLIDVNGEPVDGPMDLAAGPVPVDRP